MRHTGLYILTLGLALAACSQRASPPPPGSELPLAALVTREAVQVREDGVTVSTRWQERLVRSGEYVWVERVLAPRKAQEHESGDSERHVHDWSTVPRLVHREADGGVALQFVRTEEHELVEVAPPEFESVGFVPTWSGLAHLVPDTLLTRLAPVEKPAPKGARWLEGGSQHGYVRVLWSDRLALALEIESGRTDGTFVQRTHAQPQALPSPLPWEDTGNFARKDINDFRD